MKVSLRWLSRYVDLEDLSPQQVLLDDHVMAHELEVRVPHEVGDIELSARE